MASNRTEKKHYKKCSARRRDAFYAIDSLIITDEWGDTYYAQIEPCARCTAYEWPNGWSRDGWYHQECGRNALSCECGPYDDEDYN